MSSVSSLYSSLFWSVMRLFGWNTMTVSSDFSLQFLGKLLLIQEEVLFENDKALKLNSSKENDL